MHACPWPGLELGLTSDWVLQDTTFEMEKRRNRPEKYNRELVHKTVKAMERISEVRFSRHPLCCLFESPAYALHIQSAVFSRHRAAKLCLSGTQC